MGTISRNLEDSGVQNNVDYNSLVQEFLEAKNISNCPRDCSCDILAKNVPAFFPCPKESA